MNENTSKRVDDLLDEIQRTFKNQRREIVDLIQVCEDHAERLEDLEDKLKIIE